MTKKRKTQERLVELTRARSLTPRQKRQIQTVASIPEENIDTSDIPELPPGARKNAVRGKWDRPVKQAVSIRLDADVLAWLKSKGNGYQTRVNSMLRERMLQELRK